MKILFLVLVGLMVLPSCKAVKRLVKPGEYSPEYLREDSPLDPPGMAAARRAERERLVKDGKYREGESVDVQQGKVYLFNRNPDLNSEASGEMVKTERAKVISCEGLYYFVETDDGRKGFIRESDFVNPVRLVSTSEFPGLGEGNPAWTGTAEGLLPGGAEGEPEVALPGNQKLMTNENGRTVVVVSKKSERSQEFEAKKRALSEGESAPASDSSSSEADPPYEPLPAPSASLPQ